MNIDSTPDWVRSVYETSRKRIETARKRLGRPLTYAEKVLFGHLDDPAKQELERGKSMLALRVDRVAMQDATAQMALLQFAQARLPQVAIPTSVHCDHLIRAHTGAQQDTETARTENREVYDFLESASRKFGIGFWKPGAGIIHQVVLENYAFPGGLLIGTDSHTPNAGGLGMVAVGVGGADAVDAMAGMPWEVLNPKLVGIRLTGKLQGWASPKDVILWVCGKLTVKGGTNRIVEYFGPGVSSISCTGKGTIANMGAELGATTSLFPFDERMSAYLRATKRTALAELAEKNLDLLQPDAGSEKHFDEVIELDLSTLEPHIVGPHTPDLARPVSKLKQELKEKGYPDHVAAALIGSCTNSSYEDLSRVRDIAEQARKAGLKAATTLYVTPGSDQIYETIKRDGHVETLAAVGATVLANACGPCIGQWKRDDVKQGQKNSIVSSFNRNFPGRNDGNPETLSFLASPEITLAYGLAGTLSVDPTSDAIQGLRLKAPAQADDLPRKGFVEARGGYVNPPADGSAIEIKVAPDSNRLQLLEPFAAWDGKDLTDCPLLLKAKGKCTTDHISPAGTWLRFRGHLDKISDNMFTMAVNSFSGKAGLTRNLFTGTPDQSIPQVARDYKARGLKWIVVGDENYGEGSSREHAAMEPRYLNGVAVIARSFARIHETNLKKQGLLPLTFSNAADYDRVQEQDRISLLDLKSLAPGKPVRCVLRHSDGRTEELSLRHSFTTDQIGWFKAGGALNALKKKLG